jgi:DNA-binding MarR family transcriptional regulator
MTTTNPAEAITSALADHPEATAAQLADLTGIGRSTANKFLAALEREGTVVRRPGGHVGGRRAADHWSLAGGGTDATVGDTAAPEGTNDPPDDETSEDAEPSAVEPGERDTDTTGAARLGRGELSGLVLDYLTEHGGEGIGPSAIAKALERSSGAVGNACERLTETGKLRRTSDAPRRYAVAS